MHTIKIRRCIACRRTNLKQNLIRVCRVNGEYIIDHTHKLNGRSAYICNEKDCINKVIDKKLLNRAFKTNLEDIYINLRGCIE